MYLEDFQWERATKKLAYLIDLLQRVLDQLEEGSERAEAIDFVTQKVDLAHSQALDLEAILVAHVRTDPLTAEEILDRAIQDHWSAH